MRRCPGWLRRQRAATTHRRRRPCASLHRSRHPAHADRRGLRPIFPPRPCVGRTRGHDGGLFRPGQPRVDSRPLTDFGWVSPTQISADLDIQDPDDFAAGPCDVEITDPRGHRAALATGFSSLGQYAFAPVLTVTSPAAGDLYAPGSTIHGEVTATDGPPGHLATLSWTYTEPPSENGSQRDPVTGNCPSGLRSDRIDCTFDVTISPDLDPGMTVNLSIVALDDSVPPNQSSPVERSHQPEPAPHRVLGHTAVRRRGGRNQCGDPRIGFACREPRLLRTSDPTTCSSPMAASVGRQPDHHRLHAGAFFRGRGPRDGAVSPGLRPLGRASFSTSFRHRYGPLPRPQVHQARRSRSTARISPRLPSSTWVKPWRALLALASATWIGAGEIDGVVPPGNGQATVWAFDSANGWTSLPDGFTWIAP